MNFSIIIPSYNNLKYLKLCVESIKFNSKYNHEIIVHVNLGTDGTIDFLKKNSILYTYTNYNAGVCESVNKAFKISSKEYILYSHDDFYFCPKWDTSLEREVNNINHNQFYLSGTMINNGQVKLDCGNDIESFDKEKLLKNLNSINFPHTQGSTWAPHLIHREYWKKVGGFSEEFFPGSGSDPDLNMKLWNVGIRIFKGVGDSLVYHFGSKTLNRKDVVNINRGGSRSNKIFLLKWKMSIKFFKKYYMNSTNIDDLNIYDGPLNSPKITKDFLFSLIKDKINFFIIYLINKFKKYI